MIALFNIEFNWEKNRNAIKSASYLVPMFLERQK